ncbi:LEA type 2 family protein [Halobaculum lipolyticum]|uniref:LEA type 2 family protein n=1 Tax=Halobaculum lipolyticum TaxID=3032001 RepID=A0ABD5WE59_9EURY|nr:LEA type 2 family protein [Halobaculum sp. DT31]
MTASPGPSAPRGRTDRAVSTVRVVAVVAVVLVAAVGGAVALGVLGAPSVVGVDNRFGDVTNETTTVQSELIVDNPNPFGVRLGGLTADYGVTMNGITMADGEKEGVRVTSGTTSIPFETDLDNSKIPAWWVSHVRDDEHTDLRVNADVRSSLVGRSYTTQVSRDVDTSIVSAFRTDEPTPLNANAPLVSDPVLILERTEADWGTVNNDTTEVEMTLYLTNPKSYPIVISEIGYDISMNDVAVGNGTAARSTTIPPGETVPVEATTAIRTQRLDEWWVSHLQRNQVTDLRMPFSLVVDLSDAGAGERRIPLDAYQRTVETDVFGTKNASDGGDTGTADGSDGGDTGTADGSDGTDDDADTAGGESTATPGDDTTATPSDGAATGTAGSDPTGTTGDDPSATPTSTPTPDGTTTDDGLLS